MNLARIQRLIQLIGLLQTGRGYNTEALAQECGVSRRTVFRDLDLLRLSGVPLLYDEQQQRYRIPGACYLPPTNFTPEEAMALLVLCHEMGSESAGVPFFGPARSAAVKLEGCLPTRLRDQLRSMTAALRIHSMPANPLVGCKPIYEQLLDATTRHVAVRIHYDSLKDGQCIVTRLCPYGLFFSRRSWYVVGRSSLHRGKRTFNLGRIKNMEVLNEHFQTPRGFTIEGYLGNAWHLIPEKGRDHEIVVRFSKLVAQNVAEVNWHKTQRLVHRDDGSMDYCVTVSGLDEISWWILGYGDQAEVIQPLALRQIVADRARRMVERYQPPQPS